jgi:hypothetical protein
MAKTVFMIMTAISCVICALLARSIGLCPATSIALVIGYLNGLCYRVGAYGPL